MANNFLKDKRFILIISTAILSIVILMTASYFQQELVEPFLILLVIFSSSYFSYKGAFVSLTAAILLLFIQDLIILDAKTADLLIETAVFITAGIFIVEHSRSLKKQIEANSEMAKKLKRRNRAYSLLTDVNQIINQTQSKSEFFDEIVKLAVEKGDYLHAWIGSWDNEAKKIDLVSYYSRENDYFKNGSFEVFNKSGKCPAVIAAENEKYIVSNDIMLDQRTGDLSDFSSENNCSSAASFPIIIEDNLWGVLTLYLEEKFFFDSEEVELLKELTQDIAMGLKSIRESERRKEYEEKLKKSEEKYRSIFNNSPVGIYRTSSDGKILIANPALAKIMGCSSVEELKNYYNDLAEDLYVDSAKRDEFLKILKKEREINDFKFRARRRDGQTIWLELNGQVNKYTDEGFIIDGFIADITDRYEMEKRLAQSEEKFRSAFMNHNSPMLIIDPDTMNIVEANAAALNFYGYNYDQITSMKISDINTSAADKVKSEVENARSQKSIKFYFKHRLKNGEIRDVEVHSGPVIIDNHQYLFSIIHDITERKYIEEKIKYMTFHDSLTDLYNRTYLEEEMQRINTQRQLPISIIMADLNNLKLVNDTYGHQKGDELLIKAAELLRNSCRHEDVIARQGGDEFVVLLPQTPQHKAEEIVERIINNAEDYKVDNEIPLSIAAGTAGKNSVDEDIYEVLDRAENRMYVNKLSSKNSSRSSFLTSFLDALKEKSNEDEEHFINVERYSTLLAEKIGLSEKKKTELSSLALFHDIGKVVIPEETLNKSGKLTDEEWTLVKQHSDSGYRIISSVGEFENLAEPILFHHEWWDGSGYPEGLAGEDIPLLSRIIAVVDAFDVMTSGRPYKEKMSCEEALKELKNCSGTQFDPQLVDRFIEIIQCSDIVLENIDLGG
jgi:diguanylate cyclase (GGDEF)-like protein/PAS domain S-box-containing protein